MFCDDFSFMSIKNLDFFVLSSFFNVEIIELSNSFQSFQCYYQPGRNSSMELVRVPTGSS